MTLDRELLKRMGWGDDLIEAATQVAERIPEPISSPVEEHVEQFGYVTATELYLPSDGFPTRRRG